MERQLVFLGTGNGMPKRSSCSCIMLRDSARSMLFDVGGGHDILGKFKSAEIPTTEVDAIFISHSDSDHILGIVPLVRAFHRWGEPKRRRIYCSKETRLAIESLFEIVANKHYAEVSPTFDFVTVMDGQTVEEGEWSITFFDVRSSKTPQFGCIVRFKDGKKLSFVGDEPLRDHCMEAVNGSDILIHEAFCLDKDEARFKAHQKHHGTVKETAINAARAGAKCLALFHMEDDTMETRKIEYHKEAKEYFSGEVFVPLDLDKLTF